MPTKAEHSLPANSAGTPVHMRRLWHSDSWGHRVLVLHSKAEKLYLLTGQPAKQKDW